MFGHQGFSESRTSTSNGIIFRLGLNIKSKLAKAVKLFTSIARIMTIETDREHDMGV